MYIEWEVTYGIHIPEGWFEKICNDIEENEVLRNNEQYITTLIEDYICGLDDYYYNAWNEEQTQIVYNEIKRRLNKNGIQLNMFEMINS